jgi:NAD(P)H-hydrate epimerase
MIAGHLPEATWLVLNEEGGVISESAAEIILNNLNRVDCLVIGPGIAREETTFRFLEKIFFANLTNNKNRRIGFLYEETNEKINDGSFPAIVLDADGLRWLAEQSDWFTKINKKMVLTPHPGEMSVLTGLSVDEIQKDRMNVASQFAKKWNQVVVLKGAFTVIASPDGRANVIPLASSALAKAGSGDVLSGMIASLFGQGLPLFEAASSAAWIHAKAGIQSAKTVGTEASVLATDIIKAIPLILADIKNDTA